MFVVGLLLDLGCVDPKKTGVTRDAVVDDLVPDAAVGDTADEDGAVSQPSSVLDAPVFEDASVFLDAAPDVGPGPRANWLACALGNQCVSGFCTDGVCCASECNGLCAVCNLARTGHEDGAPVKAGSDPDGECAEDAPNGCGSDGTCDGAGACRNRVGTPCGTASCAAGRFTPAPTCDGKGSCLSAMGSSCGSYGCAATGCKTTCAGDGDCAAGVVCVDGRCGGKRPNGAACAQAAECGTNLCVERGLLRSALQRHLRGLLGQEDRRQRRRVRAGQGRR
jgi:hypothetical protein